MKRILIAIMLFTTLIYADLVHDGMRAYNNGNYQEAKKLWEKAANQGNAEAQTNLGNMYHNGQGVRQDYQEAVKWYRKAANQGYAEAQSNLGVMYGLGQGVRQNISKAKELFGQACDNGFQKGCDAYKILNEQGVR